MTRRYAPVMFFSTLMLALGACSSQTDDRPSISDPPAASSAPSSGVQVDEVEIVKGVPDRGRDPAVVAIEIGSEGLCSGTLISPEIVLTARHCVAKTLPGIACPPTSAQVGAAHAADSLTILVGEDIEHALPMAHGRSLVTPGGVTLCDADIALIILDRPITAVKPAPVRAHGAAKGDHVRAVGFGKRTDDATTAGVKLLRDHVKVLSTTAAEFIVGEATCQGDSGGPALDEDTGAVVGVVSRGGPSCEGTDVHNIYTRVDTFLWLVDQAFQKVGEPPIDGADAGGANASTSPPKTGTPKKPASDMGGNCSKGSDCAAGVCVSVSGKQYCSRPCGSHDRCPAHYHCEKAGSSGSVCVDVS